MSTDLFPSESSAAGIEQMTGLLRDPSVSQITADRFDRISFINRQGPQEAVNVFRNKEDYIDWVNSLLLLTDVGVQDVEKVNQSVLEGSFNSMTEVHGSIHVCTKEITRSTPTVTIRKQPRVRVTLEDMFSEGMMSREMLEFLAMAVRGRSNILLSGGSGAGKTTMARALATFIDPSQRIVTVEEIEELHLDDILRRCVPLTTVRVRDEQGRMVRETSLEDLVRESLRMRASRVWVGETRGAEAYALVKACNSGHDGSMTTIHADNPQGAVIAATTYVMENPNMTKESALEQVTRAFDLVVQIGMGRMGRRIITEIAEVTEVVDGGKAQINPLFSYDHATEAFHRQGTPSPTFQRRWARYGASYDDIFRNLG